MSNCRGKSGVELLAVDWDALESAVGVSVPAPAREHIERTGSNHFWGDAAEIEGAAVVEEHSTDVMVALRDAARWVFPGGEPVDPRHLPFDTAHMGGYLRKHRGDDVNTGTLVEPIDGETTDFVAGLRTLIEAAEEMDGQRDDWHHAPQVQCGSFGPDALGNLYIHAAHADEGELREIDTDGLGVTLEHVLHHEPRMGGDWNEHYTAAFRHERYDVGDVPDEYAEEAAEIGFIGSNLGTLTSITATLAEREHDYEQVDDLNVRGTHVDLYEYVKDAETRWVAEWSERPKIDEVVWFSLVFDERPDEDTISRAALIVDARLGAEQ